MMPPTFSMLIVAWPWSCSACSGAAMSTLHPYISSCCMLGLHIFLALSLYKKWCRATALA